MKHRRVKQNKEDKKILIRVPTTKAGNVFKDKSKYSRKKKYK